MYILKTLVLYISIWWEKLDCQALNWEMAISRIKAIDCTLKDWVEDGVEAEKKGKKDHSFYKATKPYVLETLRAFQESG